MIGKIFVHVIRKSLCRNVFYRWDCIKKRPITQISICQAEQNVRKDFQGEYIPPLV